MAAKTFVGEGFELRTGASVVSVGEDADAAAGSEQTGDLDVFGFHEANEVFHDDIDAIFVEITVIAEREEIEFQTLALHHAFARDVGDTNLGKVRLSGDGAERSELRTVEAHPIVVVGVLVDEGFEHFGCVVVGILSTLAAQMLQTFSFALRHNRERRRLNFGFQIGFEPFAAQFAGRTVAAAVAHHAVVTSEGARANEVEHAQLICHAPRFGFVEPHERRVQAKLLVHGEVERDVEALDEVVAAVGIAGEVGLANSRDEIEDTALASVDGGDAEEEEVATRHEGIGRAAGGFVGIHLQGGIGERITAELSEEGHIHHFIGHLLFGADRLGDFHLVGVFLPVGEAQRVDFVEVLERPEKASGGILSAAEHHEGAAG